MIREGYKLDNNGLEPVIVKVPVTDLDAVSWQKAKAALRQFYLDKARALRSVTEVTYFQQ